MPEKWTGDLIGRMHNEGVQKSDLAEELGVSKYYLSQILHSVRKPPNAEQRLNDAFERVLAKKAVGLKEDVC